MSVAVIDANESPYKMEKDAERNRDCKPCTPQRWRRVITETLHVLPVLPKECEDTEWKGENVQNPAWIILYTVKPFLTSAWSCTCKGKSVEVGRGRA